jgi:hypothetical protein
VNVAAKCAEAHAPQLGRGFESLFGIQNVLANFQNALYQTVSKNQDVSQLKSLILLA